MSLDRLNNLSSPWDGLSLLDQVAKSVRRSPDPLSGWADPALLLDSMPTQSSCWILSAPSRRPTDR